MRLRTSDEAYLAHVDRWWGQLFSRLRRLLYQEGGPVAMVQVGVLGWPFAAAALRPPALRRPSPCALPGLSSLLGLAARLHGLTTSPLSALPLALHVHAS